MSKVIQSLGLVYVLCSLVAISSAYAQAQQTQADQTAQEPKGKVWGYFFGDLFWKAGGENPGWGRYEYAKTDKDIVGGRLRRMYFGYDYKISDVFFTRLILESNENVTTLQGNFGVLVKLGYLEWKNPFNLIPNSTLRGGLIATPVFAYPEKSWAYRSIEKEALDLRGFSQSSDQGIALDIDFNNEKTVGITLMGGNGTGTKPGVNRKMEYYASIYRKLLNNKLSFELMGNYKKSSDSTDRIIGRFFASYETSKFRWGLEVSDASVDETVSGKNAEVFPFVFSIYTSFMPYTRKEDLRAFLRFDLYDPDLRYKTGETYLSPSENYREMTYIAGLELAVHKNVKITPNLSINSYHPKASDIQPRKADVVPRVTLYWLFGS